MFIKNILMFLIIGLFLGCNAQKNPQPPSLETTTFPQYPKKIEPINELLFMPYPLGSYQQITTMKTEVAEKNKSKLTVSELNIVSYFKREKIGSNEIKVINNNSFTVGNKLAAFLNCTYTVDTKNKGINDFSCIPSDINTKKLIDEIGKESTKLTDIHFLNVINNGIKTGTVFQISKIDFPFLKDLYLEEIVEGIGSFGQSNVLVVKVDFNKNIQGLGNIVMKGYKLYDLKNSYPIFGDIKVFYSNDTMSGKITMQYNIFSKSNL